MNFDIVSAGGGYITSYQSDLFTCNYAILDKTTLHCVSKTPISAGAFDTIKLNMKYKRCKCETAFLNTISVENMGSLLLNINTSNDKKSANFPINGGACKTSCGDGIVQQPNDDGVNEQCDDENTNNTDACSNTCERNHSDPAIESNTKFL